MSFLFMRWRGTATSSTARPHSRPRAFPRKSFRPGMETGGVHEISTWHDDKIKHVHCRKTAAGGRKVSLGHDAGTPPRLQFDLHGLRPHPGIQVYDHRAADGGAVLEGRGGMRRSD